MAILQSLYKTTAKRKLLSRSPPPPSKLLSTGSQYQRVHIIRLIEIVVVHNEVLQIIAVILLVLIVALPLLRKLSLDLKEICKVQVKRQVRFTGMSRWLVRMSILDSRELTFQRRDASLRRRRAWNVSNSRQQERISLDLILTFLRSSFVSFWSEPLPRAALASCKATMRSSMLPFMMRRYTLTGRVWPIR